MTNDEMELKMEFLLKQQESQSDQISEIIEGLRELKEQQADITKRQASAQVQIDKNSEHIGVMMQAIVGLTAMATTLSQKYEEAEVARREADQALKELAERQDAFILVL